VPRDVPDVARLGVPVEVPHRLRQPSIDAVARPRHLLLNALFLEPGASGGPETYLRGLAPTLALCQPGLRMTVATTGSGAESLKASGWSDFCDVRALPCEDGQRGRRQLAEQVLLPALARRVGADLVHSLASVAPIRTPGTAHVITLHDVTFLHLATFGRLTTWGMGTIISRAARHADGLIAGTAVARDDICATLGIPTERFTVVHHGIDHAPVAAAPVENVRRSLGLGERRVVLCVGAKRPHKNQELLVRAAVELPDDVVVVLVGHPEPYEDELRALAVRLGVQERVLFTGWLSAADLEGLWELASCAAFPTRAEGFGFPVVEALRRGVPVAASDLPVFREVAGDLPEYMDPERPETAVAAITALLEAMSPDGVARGRTWAQRFTWERAAEQTWGVYARALGGSS